MSRFYQIRMRFGPGGDDLARQVWETGHVGMWFGGWVPDEYARSPGLSVPERLHFLNDINRREGVNWSFQND